MFAISRRDLMLSAAGAYAAFGLTKPVAFIGAAHAQQTPSRDYYRYTVGDIEVTSLSDGSVEVPRREGWIRNASADQMKAALRASGLPDAGVPVPFTVTAARMGTRLILIDTGTGSFPIYGPKAGLLAQSMMMAGLDPKAVNTILISHLHGDHIYGLMDKETNAQIFPEAEIIVPAGELKWWTQPGVETIDLGPSRKGLAQRIQSTLATWKNVRPVDGEVELVPGIRAIHAPGHSPGQVTHSLSSGGRQLLLTADVSLLPALFAKNPDWQVILDQDPVMAVTTRKRIFERAISENALVTGTHWILPNVGTLARDGNGYAFIPVSA